MMMLILLLFLSHLLLAFNPLGQEQSHTMFLEHEIVRELI